MVSYRLSLSIANRRRSPQFPTTTGDWKPTSSLSGHRTPTKSGPLRKLLLQSRSKSQRTLPQLECRPVSWELRAPSRRNDLVAIIASSDDSIEERRVGGAGTDYVGGNSRPGCLTSNCFSEPNYATFSSRIDGLKDEPTRPHPKRYLRFAPPLFRS